MSIIRNIPRRLLELSIAINIALLIWFFFYRGDTPDGAPTYDVWERKWGVGEAYSKKLEYQHAEKEQWQGEHEQEAGSDLVDRAAAGSGCEMCAMDPVLCQELGRTNLERSLLFSGTGTRFQRMLSKLKRGERLVAGVIGGSVSKGHGINSLPSYGPDQSTNLNRIVFDRLNYLFPAPNGVVNDKSGREEGKNSYINGAQGGVGSDYFSLCYGEHIPEDVDVVFVDLAINDEALVKNIDSYELLVRSLLDLPNKPAILNMDVFALMFKTVTNGGDLHSGIAQFYDIPTVSLRNALYHQVLANASLISELFIIKEDGEVDTRHLGVKGHNLLGRIGAAYVDSQVCEMEKHEANLHQPEQLSLDELYPIAPLPRMQLNQRYDNTTNLPKITPQCFSATALHHPLSPIPSSSTLGLDGWHPWAWADKKYLVSTTPGARVSFELETRLGRIEMHYLRSKVFGLGSVRCWVDGDGDGEEGGGVRLDGYWNEVFNIGRATTIKTGLSPGKHILTCEHLNETKDPKGGKEFRLISVMSI
ncbi:hypothetical protein B9479_005175 [Cryptococcus floricola]|uniref:SGNH hydrolase-type esterase domain-containing protein n=1 Tax=Cryptococcus floricola TaxID=2591691 RepID=A0A5D3AU60_9TREE|nr:hypothetical protein B9479_005175 [Cryptococcus floricola]